MNKKIHLIGYFDQNFGDDMMMKLVVRSLPDVTFSVHEKVVSPIVTEPNVIVQSQWDCEVLPKLVVIGSGFMINSRRVLLLELAAFLKRQSPGDFCLGCNMEPLDDPLKRFLIGRKMNKFKLITCRDSASYDWLRRHTRRPEIHRLPDLLFSIPDEWLPVQNKPDKLGISLMHRTGDREDCAYYRTMAKLADEWIRENGKNVILMAFDTGREDDLFACTAVKGLMEYPGMVQIAAHHDCTQIPEAFSHCEKIIAGRFHAMVLALRMQIPVYPLIFREKGRNLLKDLEFPYDYCEMDDIDTASLRAFLLGSQTPYRLDKEIILRAREHTKRLLEHIAEN